MSSQNLIDRSISDLDPDLPWNRPEPEPRPEPHAHVAGLTDLIDEWIAPVAVILTFMAVLMSVVIWVWAYLKA